MNKFSIFHTSHCGSTLLASMVSKSIDTYTEPRWSHSINLKKTSQEVEKYVIQNHPDNTLVKYSSVYCYVSPLLPDKKVFLYRKLKHHMQKALLHADALITTVEWNLDVMKLNHHPLVEAVPLSGTHLHACAYLWVDRFLWMREAINVLWIDSDDFFDNPKRTAEKVCEYFGVPYRLLEVPFNVKRAGLNHSDTPINVDEVEELNKDLLNPVDAKIVHFTHNDMMNQIIEQVRKLFPMIEDKFYD